jgi:hypothetical protein
MKYYLFAFLATALSFGAVHAQKSTKVPPSVRTAFSNKYPEAAHSGWKKAKGNYTASWKDKSGKRSSASFSPAGEFIEVEEVVAPGNAPKEINVYVQSHYKEPVKSVAMVTDATGKITYEVMVGNKLLIFDENGNFVTVEK